MNQEELYKQASVLFEEDKSLIGNPDFETAENAFKRIFPKVFKKKPNNITENGFTLHSYELFDNVFLFVKYTNDGSSDIRIINCNK